MEKKSNTWFIKCCVRLAVLVLCAVLSGSVMACFQTEPTGHVADGTDGNTSETNGDDAETNGDDAGTNGDDAGNQR